MGYGLQLGSNKGVVFVDSKNPHMILYDFGIATANVPVQISFAGVPWPAIPLLKPRTDVFLSIGRLATVSADFGTAPSATITAENTHDTLYELDASTLRTIAFTASNGWWNGNPSYAGVINGWWSNNDASVWWKIDFGAGVTKTLKTYAMRNLTHEGIFFVDSGGGTYHTPNSYGYSPVTLLLQTPHDWTFQGSNNDSTWTTIDTQTGVTWDYGGQWKIFDCSSNTTAYRYYRIVISANNGGEMVGISGFKVSENAVTDLAFFEVYADYGTTTGDVEWALYSFLESLRLDCPYGLRIRNSRGEHVFDSSEKTLQIVSVHDVTISTPAYNSYTYTDVTHGAVSNPYYLVTPPGYAYFYNRGNPNAAGDVCQVGIKKISGTQVRVGWHLIGGASWGEVSKTTDYILNPGFQLVVCDVVT